MSAAWGWSWGPHGVEECSRQRKQFGTYEDMKDDHCGWHKGEGVTKWGQTDKSASDHEEASWAG